MSRAAASKARGADKTKPPASQTPVIAHEIVPGKFNDSDWNVMLEREGGEEFVLDIMDELMETTMTTIYNKYIERQLLPFTITQAKDAIIEIIEWQFLIRDEGEENIEADLGWTQDEEPEPAETDCWAQGSVPKNIILAPTPELEEIPEEAEEVPQEQEEEDKDVQEEVSQEPPELDDVVSETEETSQAVAEQNKKEKETEKIPIPPKASSSDSSRKKFRPYRGRLKSAGVGKMTESLEDTEIKMIYNEIVASMPPSEEKPSTLLNMPASCTSILKVQTGRPPGNKDVVYDELGNVVAVMKLDPEKLPTHKVSVKYHVVDPAVEAAQARLDAMRKGKSTGKMRKMKSNKNLTTESATGGLSKTKVQANHGSVAPLPPPLASVDALVISLKQYPMLSDARYSLGHDSSEIEEMEVSHGVIIREGGRVKKGPGRYYRKLDILEEHQKGMKPVSVRLNNAGITVNDLLDRNTPILRPLAEQSPLPPIIPQPPPQPQQSQVS